MFTRLAFRVTISTKSELIRRTDGGNRVALLVGAGDAIGAAVARRFARGGYKVCAARREAAKSQGLLDEAKAAGHDIRAFSVDARNEAEVQGLFARVEAEVGPLDICLFNAGFLVGREAARHMVPRGRGSILFTGATASIRGGSSFAAFAAAKFGLRAVAQSMARELGPKNTHVVHLLIDAGVDSEAIHQRMRTRGIDAKDIAADSRSGSPAIFWPSA
jgi:NAD(P)-dependent dehydrogenase (short-subunit alcohol dehydrogenase family)